jgi:hypothetical protein
MKSVTDEQQDANNKGKCLYLPSTLGHLCLYPYYETVLAFGIYTAVEIVPCNEIQQDELSEQSCDEIRRAVFTK